MCQLCRLTRRYSQSQLSSSSLLDTSKFSSLIVTDHRQKSGQLFPQLSAIPTRRLKP